MYFLFMLLKSMLAYLLPIILSPLTTERIILDKNSKHCLCHDIGTVSSSFRLKKPACRGISPWPPYPRKGSCFLPTQVHLPLFQKIVKKGVPHAKKKTKNSYTNLFE